MTSDCLIWKLFSEPYQTLKQWALALWNLHNFIYLNFHINTNVYSFQSIISMMSYGALKYSVQKCVSYNKKNLLRYQKPGETGQLLLLVLNKDFLL